MKIFIHIILAVSLVLFMLIVFLLMIYILIVEGYQDLKNFWSNKKSQIHKKKPVLLLKIITIRLKNLIFLYKIKGKILIFRIFKKFRG